MNFFISRNEKRAQLVVDTFRKTVLSNSRIATMIMGFMLADNIQASEDITHKQLILYMALDNVTDMDLRHFNHIMKRCINYKKEIHLERLKLSKTMEENYVLTCDWCVYNRIFSVNSEMVDIDDEVSGQNDILGADYLTTPIADCLYEYIKKIPYYLLEDNEV